MTQPSLPTNLTNAYNLFLESLPGLFNGIVGIFEDPDTYLAAEEIAVSIFNISVDGVEAGSCIAALAGLP
jgi:hypothetical protein